MSSANGGSEYDVQISASVSARELTFHEVPEVRSRARGGPDHESASNSERRGLPQPVRSGEVYTDIRVDYRLASRIRPREAPSDPRGGQE